MTDRKAIDPKTIAETYLAFWNEGNGDLRRGLIGKAMAADVTYIDPLMKGEGREGVAAMIDAALAQYPGHGFTLRGMPDGHADFVRFSWTFAPAGGEAVADGTDIVRLNGAGEIAEVVGFLDAVRPAGQTE